MIETNIQFKNVLFDTINIKLEKLIENHTNIVIDDIDNINEQCQQVFRNYIDKYKKNIHFISVCSNIQKVNESLQSRLHILKINQVNRANLETTMAKIVEKEGLIIDADAKEFILNISDNSIRVLINHLEKILLQDNKLLCSNSTPQNTIIVAATRILL